MTETIVFAGGCFWCTEAVFKRLRGVHSVVPGYTGGIIVNPTYEQVCSGKSGHAEAIKIEYDPEAISIADLYTVFFSSHDPTTLNRQGNDVGTQYRSAIFYTTGAQRFEAEKYIAELNAAPDAKSKIVTEVSLLTEFYPAEKEHLDYFERNPEQAYCQIVIAPKVHKLEETLARLLKD
jgi:peptide-methionine (S)-S-oxide reductase